VVLGLGGVALLALAFPHVVPPLVTRLGDELDPENTARLVGGVIAFVAAFVVSLVLMLVTRPRTT
jgi:hypothetical protein